MRFEQRILGLAAMRAGVHAQGAADRPGNAAIEREAVDAGLGRRARRLNVRDRRADAQTVIVLDRDFAKALGGETDDDALHAAVAHDEIGAEPDDRDGNFARQVFRENKQRSSSSAGMNKNCAGPPTRNQV